MKTFNAATIEKLRTLISEIDNEESKDECDGDIVIENLYKVCDIVREAIAIDETKPTFPTVVLKLALYNYDENDEPIRMDDDVTAECIADIISADDVNGYSITDYEVIEDTLTF